MIASTQTIISQILSHPRRQKPHQIIKHEIFDPKLLRKENFVVEQGNVGTRPKDVLTQFDDCKSGKRKPTPRSNLPPGPFRFRSGSVRGPLGVRSAQFRTKLFGAKNLKFQKNLIVTLREAKRGSAGVLVAKREAAGDTQSVQEMTM